MKVVLAQKNFRISDIKNNTAIIMAAINDAKKKKADLIVFSELALTAYPPTDFFFQKGFEKILSQEIEKIAAICQNITCVLGAPSKNKGNGRSYFNSAYVLNNGTIEKIIHKTLLPEYDVFFENRYFQQGSPHQDNMVEIKQKKCAITICEDIWEMNNNYQYDSYPLENISGKEIDLIINISSSPFDPQQLGKRLKLCQHVVERYKVPILYLNTVGAQTETIFDGGSFYMPLSGEPTQLPLFEEHEACISILPDEQKPFSSISDISPTQCIFDALVFGLRDFFSKLNLKKAIVGLSGGIDSALVATIASKALGSSNVHCVLLPSEYTSKQSTDDAHRLVQNLSCTHRTISIDALKDHVFDIADHIFGQHTLEVTKENIQSRLRALLLMSISNNENYILLNTSNKSEISVGYGTLYGDLTGALSVIGDVFKTRVFELAKWANREKGIIPASIIKKEPSAELKPNQKDLDTLPAYEILDPILELYIEKRESIESIVRKGFGKDVVLKIVDMVHKAEFKRYQTPPILRVSSKSYGMGRRMDMTANYNPI